MPHTAHRLALLSATRSSSIGRYLARSNAVHVESSDTMRSRKAQFQAPPDNPETGDTYHSGESRSCAVEKIRAPKRIQKRHSSSSAGMYTSEADFHKPGIYGGMVPVWAAAWDVFRRAPSGVGRGGRAAVDFVVCFGLGGLLSDFFFVFNEARPRERRDRGRFSPLGKKTSSYRGAYRVPLFN